MSGICGWFGAPIGDAAACIDAMRRRITWPGGVHERLIGPTFGLAAVGPSNTTATAEIGPLRIAFHGHGHWRANGASTHSPAEICARVGEAYRHRGAHCLEMLGGDFALAILDVESRKTLLAIDRMGVRNLAYRKEREVLVFAANLDSLAAHPLVSQRIEPQALYNYVYFHMVPGPGTVFEGTYRLLPGHYLELDNAGTGAPKPYWEMSFHEAVNEAEATLASRFRSTLRASVDECASNVACGTFLSGGTDSSTVTGLLAAVSGQPVKSYSIGFDAAGYDEMEYARIAARHFKAMHREYYVTPADVVAAVPELAAEYDQPFGNASAVPTYYCARLAHADGVTRMLGGDGGDELFGGNSRYATQYQLSLYQQLPRFVREELLEPLLRTNAAGKLALTRKAASYVRQARLPMPDRYEPYNLLERLGSENVFHPDFLSTVDRGRPLAMMKEVYDTARAESLINRLLAVDLKFTLADNDLPKVTRMCDRAGVDVTFPLLQESVVAFSADLAPRLKLNGTRLRPFFKSSLRGFLPPEIIAKHKHGFGLPAGQWLASYAPLRDLSRDALASLGKRGLVRPEFIDDLLGEQLQQHAGYYGTMVWILMMLELWFRNHIDPH